MLNDGSFASLSLVVLDDQMCHGCSRCDEEKEEIVEILSPGLIQVWGLLLSTSH